MKSKWTRFKLFKRFVAGRLRDSLESFGPYGKVIIITSPSINEELKHVLFLDRNMTFTERMIVKERVTEKQAIAYARRHRDNPRYWK